MHEDQCVAVGDTVTDVALQYTCASLTCRKDISRQFPFYFDIEETGAFLFFVFLFYAFARHIIVERLYK